MNRKNLEILVAGLRTVPENKFTMATFCTKDGEDHQTEYIRKDTDIKEHMCGSSACVVGWSPTFKGLEVIDADFYFSKSNSIFYNPHGTLSYTEYSNRLFELDEEQWEWCFGGDWDQHDNSIDGAIKRINYMLKNDIPNNFEDSHYASSFVKLYEEDIYA